MGCNCSPNKSIIEDEYKMEKVRIIKRNKSNDIFNKLKNKSNKKNNQEIEKIQHKFIEILKGKENYNILDSIELKDYFTYECLQAYEIFMNDKNKFEDIYKKEFPEENDEKNSDTSEEEKLFKMPPIQYLNNTIYEGEFFFNENKNQWEYGGDGMLITSKKELIQINNLKKNDENINQGIIFYPNGDIFMGEINKKEPYEKIKGIYFENKEGKYDNYIVSKNFENTKMKIQKYFSNGDLYIGEAEYKNNKFILSGKGELKIKKDNSIYNGEFSNNLFNGEGNLFKPIGDINNNENIGTTIITNWINGKPFGNGLIREKNSISDEIKSTTCSFRYGKIIKCTKNLVKGKKILNENIYNFLTLFEISKLNKNLKTKSFYKYIKKNFSIIKLYNSLLKYELGIYDPNLFNYELYYTKKQNLEEINLNVMKDKSYFLPFVCYYTDGGEIEKRYRAYNIFNPNRRKIYSTNYLNHKSSNITIKGIISLELFEDFKNREEYVYDKNLTQFQNFTHMAVLYNFFYEKFERNYPVRIIDTDIIDYKEYVINKEKIGDYDKILCIFEYIMLSIPDKIDDLTILINPCYFFAVYIGNYNDINNNQKYLNIDDQDIKENNYEIHLISEKYKNYVIKIEKEKQSFEYIEFDTLKQNNFGLKLLCLIKICEKNDLNYPYIIKLKKYFHVGNIVLIKLINQYNILNKSNEGFSIDFGTINFYGNIVYLNE